MRNNINFDIINDYENIKTADEEMIKLYKDAQYTRNVLRCNNLFPIREIAKDYGMTSQKMNKLLHEIGIQYKSGKRWFLYEEYQDNGYTGSYTHYFKYYYKNRIRIGRNNYMKWTEKGRYFIYHLLKNKYNIVPTLERK